MDQEDPNWLTIGELAERWRVSYDTVRRDILSGKIPSLCIGANRRRISRETVESMEASAMRKGVRAAKYVLAHAGGPVKDYYPDC